MGDEGNDQPGIAEVRAFGLNFAPIDLAQLTEIVLRDPIDGNDPPRIIATANLDHIVNMSTNVAFRAAYERAWVITADGTPVYLYAKWKGVDLKGRLTGSDLCRDVLNGLSRVMHRCYFVGNSSRTISSVKQILLEKGFDEAAIASSVPPFGFENDCSYSSSLAEQIKNHGTTHLFFSLGSPKSEIWTDKFRENIGGCYVLNIGAGLEFFAGTKTRAPQFVQRYGLEWAWRLASEPRRLARRYLINSWRFIYLMFADMRA